MKLVIILLVFIGFVTTIDAKAVDELLNGGQILSPDDKYILGKLDFLHIYLIDLLYCFFVGIVPRILRPIFEKLKECSHKYAVVDVLLFVMYDSDTALATKNSSYLLLVFKVSVYLYQMQLPFIENKQIYAIFVEIIETSEQIKEHLSNGHIDLCEINDFYIKFCNALNDNL